MSAPVSKAAVREVRRYTLQDLGGTADAAPSGLTQAVADRFISAFVRARKPRA